MTPRFLSIDFAKIICYYLKERVKTMEKQFIRAKSQENKNIRIQQIMDATDRLFYEKTYHEITLTSYTIKSKIICKMVQITFSGN